MTCVHEPVFYTVIIASGRSTTGRRVTDGTTICRDSSHFNLAIALIHENEARVWEENVLERENKTEGLTNEIEESEPRRNKNDPAPEEPSEQDD